MNTYIIGLFDRGSDNPNDMPVLEFTLEADSADEAKEKLFSQVVRLEVLELSH